MSSLYTIDVCIVCIYFYRASRGRAELKCRPMMDCIGSVHLITRNSRQAERQTDRGTDRDKKSEIQIQRDKDREKEKEDSV